MTKKTTINEIKGNFRHLVEYVINAPIVDEDGEDSNAIGGDQNAIGGSTNAIGGDQGMMGGDQNAMGGDPNDMGGDQSMMGGDPNAIGGDQNAMGYGQSPEGFAPQGADQGMPMDGMGGEQNVNGGEETPGPDDDVIEIDDLTDAQEDTEHKVDVLTSKFERLMSSIDSIEKRINDIDAHTNQYLGSLKGEMEKRNPTPMQRLTMRSTKSSPYSMTPNEYMNNYAPENYSDADDNNGADDPQYKITKGDIDDFVDYNSIAKDIANNKMDLKDIFGY